MPLTPAFRSHLISALVGASLLTSVVATAGSAHGTGVNDEWKANVAQNPAAAGTVATTKLALTLLVDTHHPFAVIGSFAVTPPAGFTIQDGTAKRGRTAIPVTVVGGVARIEGVDLRRAGQTVRVKLRSKVTCGTDGEAGWKLIGHENADLSVSSRNAHLAMEDSLLATPVVPCSLAFVRQPALTGVGQVISSVQANPLGASVAIQLRDGTGAPAAQSGVSITLGLTPGTGSPSATLGGTTAGATNGGGVATFAPTIDKIAKHYRLDADAGPGITGATSDLFDVPGVAVACTGTCAGQDSKGGTSASVSANTNGVLTLTMGEDDLDCNNAVNQFYVGASEPIVFDVTDSTGRTVVTMKLDAASVDRKTSKYQVCFSSPMSTFTNRYGAVIGPDAAGVLPRCWGDEDDEDDEEFVVVHEHQPLPSDAQACMEKRWKDHDGNVFVRFSVPPGDPRAKF